MNPNNSNSNYEQEQTDSSPLWSLFAPRRAVFEAHHFAATCGVLYAPPEVFAMRADTAVRGEPSTVAEGSQSLCLSWLLV